MRLLFFNGFLEGAKGFGAGIIHVTNLIILFPVYIIGIGISSLTAKIRGKKLLDLRKPDKRIKSYWTDADADRPFDHRIEKEHRNKGLEDSYRQF